MQFFIEGENALASRRHSFAFADQSPQGGGVTLPTAVLLDWSHRPTFETALAHSTLTNILTNILLSYCTVMFPHSPLGVPSFELSDCGLSRTWESGYERRFVSGASNYNAGME